MLLRMRSRSSARLSLALALALLACAAPDAIAGAPVGTHPVDVAVDPIANRVYVANLDDDSVSVVDGARLSSQSVLVGDEPVALAVDPVAGLVWVASDAGAMVTRIAGADLSAVPVPLAAGALQIAVDPTTREAWVATDAGTVVRIDAALGTQSATVAGASFLAIDWLANRVWVAGTPLAYVDGDDLEVHAVPEVALPGGIAVDPVADRVCASRPSLDQLALLSGTSFDQDVATGDRPEIVAIDPIAQRFYAVNRTDESVSLVESDLQTATAVIGATVGAVVANPNTGHLAVLEPDASKVAIVDGTTVVHHPISLYATSAALNPVTNRLYVTNAADNSIEALDTGVLGAEQIDAGDRPNAVAIDRQRELVYVTNSGTGDVSVVDGTTHAVLETVPAGTLPIAVAVDEITGNAYVANAGSNDVTVIQHGAAGFTSQTIAVGTRPVAIAANAATGAVFVANHDSDDVTRIAPNGGGFSKVTLAVGDGPVALAVDPNANRVFVANGTGDSVTRIDGATFAKHTFAVAGHPAAIAVDPRDGVAYVASPGAGAVVAIDGLATAPIGEVVGATSIAVDPVLGRVYANNSLADDVSAIDLATGTTKRIQVGASPLAVLLDPVANRILAIRSDAMMVIDGVALTMTPIPDASIGTCAGLPLSPAFDPVTGHAYVPSCPGGAVAVISEQRQANPLSVAISGDDGITQTTTPSLDFAATNAFAPNAPPVTGIYYQVDSWMGPWSAATPSGATGSATLSLAPGPHVVYAFAVDGHEAASSASPASVALVGAIAATPILVAPTPVPEPGVALLGAAACAALATLRRRR